MDSYEGRERGGAGETDPLLAAEDDAAARVREQAAYENAGKSDTADLDGISADVSAFGQEILAPGQRGPPHLRQLDILI